MKNDEITLKEIANHWKVHPSTVPKIMARWGYSGRKNGTGRGCRHTYLVVDFFHVNYLRMTAAGQKGAK